MIINVGISIDFPGDTEPAIITAFLTEITSRAFAIEQAGPDISISVDGVSRATRVQKVGREDAATIPAPGPPS